MTDPSQPNAEPDASSPPQTWMTRVPSNAEGMAPSVNPDDYETIASSAQPASQEAVRAPIHVPGYEILEELGRGGMGVVYKARQVGLNRTVALKMILSGAHASRNDVERFRREAEAIARLRHENIVQVYQIDEHEGRPFFSMEFVGGGSLADRIQGKPQPARESAAMVEQLARAVHVAHEAGIVHRDLKPANVLLAACSSADSITKPQASIAKITDFGLAKRLEEDQSRTKTGDILGTPNYMAPEQASGKISLIGPATDVHALGAMLYEMLTGRPPYGKTTLLDTLEQVRSHDAMPARQVEQSVPRDLEVICQKCLRKIPGERYASAQELADDLRRFLDGDPIRARPMSWAERAYKTVLRHPVRVGIAVLALIAVGVFLLLLRTREEPIHDEKVVRSTASQVRRKLFERMYQARTPEGWIINDLSPKSDPTFEQWSHAQALTALFRCPEAKPEELHELVRSLEVMRTTADRKVVDGVAYGWPARPSLTHTQAEHIFWTASVVALALNLPDILTGETREKQKEFLSEIHTVLRVYEPKDAEGGWHAVPNPKDPSLQYTYINVLALQALLDTRQAGLPWDGSAERRDALIAQTARWLQRNHRANEEPAGWFKDNHTRDRTIDGLTLQAYAVLFRATNEAKFPLSDDLFDAARDHLRDCGTRPLTAPDQSAYMTYTFRRHDGKDAQEVPHLTFLWYPWAIDASVQWLEQARRRQLSDKQTADVRRTLGKLVVDLGPDAVTSGEAFIYILSERLYALASVPLPRAK